ncbi:hypothetical protein [Candidatus Uabimicrobium amorphum]|uniref:FrpA/C n=1 Tax=Uabimicrobium amorphum TaxID=2596890 RepID=A0A5S9ILE9_UABAM|nr:hypothetical protein [Candidatus Uabimicrobium amorphum]BBM84048.1 FrpA/C [Candidatus Uabimicrobium amorphum]
MKYFIIFLLIPTLALSSLWADDGDSVAANSPENFMDSPVENSELPPVFGIEFHDDLVRIFRDPRNGFRYLEDGVDDLGIGHVLNYLAGLEEHFHHGNADEIKGRELGGGRFNFNNTHHSEVGIVEGDALAFTNALGNFISDFNASTEVFNSIIMQGESAFFNALGQETTNTDPEDVYDGEESAQTVTVYAGRNTAAVPSSSQYYQNGQYSSDNGDYTNEMLLATITTPNGVFELNAFGVATPIVLDMDGDKRLEASGGKWLPHSSIEKDTRRAFDINGDGFPEVIEWVGPNDGLLVQYDGGQINGNHLFGDAGGFKHGFEKLSLLDENNDNVLNGAELETLSVWQDKNSNAKVDNGEVKSLQELNITSINVKHRLFTSSFTQNGESKMLWDWHPATHMVKKIK